MFRRDMLKMLGSAGLMVFIPKFVEAKPTEWYIPKKHENGILWFYRKHDSEVLWFYYADVTFKREVTKRSTAFSWYNCIEGGQYERRGVRFYHCSNAKVNARKRIYAFKCALQMATWDAKKPKMLNDIKLSRDWVQELQKGYYRG